MVNEFDPTLHEPSIPSENWYAEIISSANADEVVSESQMEQALRIVGRFLPLIEQAVSDGELGDVELSFTIKTEVGDLEFNYATD